MFERFTRSARMTVVEAQREAADVGDAEILPAHLLIALHANADEFTGQFLADRLPGSETIAAEFSKIRRRGGLTDADAEALEQLGIDVLRIVDAVERAHGEGALAPVRKRSRRKHLPFSKDAKATLEQTLREAIEIGDRFIGTEHLLLALVSRPGPASDLLAKHGIDRVAVHAALSEQRRAG